MSRRCKWTIVVVVAALICLAVSATAVWAVLTPSQVKGNQLATLAFYANDIPVGWNPQGLAFDGTNVWVANSYGFYPEGNSVSKINASTGAASYYGNLDQGPCALAFDGSYIYVACYKGNFLDKLNPSTGAIVDRWQVVGGPRAVLFDGTYIWVARYLDKAVTRYSKDGNGTSITRSVGAAASALAFDGTSVWVACVGTNSVKKFNASSAALVNTYAVGSQPYALAFDGTSIWTANYASNTVTKLNAANGAVLGTYAVGSGPYALAFDQPGYSNGPVTDPKTYMWVACKNNSMLYKLDTKTGAIVGSYPVGTYPAGLAFDGTNMWVSQYTVNSVAKIRAR